jgi:3-oxoacyl-[acyl-carrier-protein] synthase I
MHPLRLSHLCAATSLGDGLDPLLSALRTGRSGLRPCTFESAGLPTYTGAIDALDDFRLAGDFAAFDCRNNALAEIALRQDGFDAAVAAARQRYGADRIGVFLGTSTSGILSTEHAYRARDPATGALPPDFRYETTHNTYSLAAFVRRRLGLSGPSLVVSCACASTAKAFGNAARMIEAGLCDAAIVGGADTLCLTTMCGFASLQLTGAGPCRPCDADRDGISIGEAAGFALLEKANSHNGDVLLLGIGESNDAYHMSSPHPQGAGARLAMERALDSAGLAPGDIDYVNLHATATMVGDSAEDHAVADVFGPHTPCSSTKGLTGHVLGAASILEAIISALAIRHQFAPGTANTAAIDPSFRCRHLLESTPLPIRRVMSNSFGFGGSNCSLILGAAA